MSKSTNKNKSNTNKPYALSTVKIEKIVENSQRIEGFNFSPRFTCDYDEKIRS